MVTAVRRYECQDLDSVLSVWEKASVVAHPFLNDEFFEKEIETILGLCMLDDLLEGAELWVAVRECLVVGFIAIVEDEIELLFVRPDCRHSGIGHALMDKACALRKSLEVEVFKNNAAGWRFYMHYGFELASVRKHPQSGYTLLRMKLPPAHSLPPPPLCS